MLTYPPEPGRDVLILGAGFSHALSPEMPLTDALGEKVLARADLAWPSRRPFEGGSFEAWLSRIADDQPDLDATANRANRAVFQRCSEILTEVLTEAVEAALPDALGTAWLTTLVRLLHLRQATVITFNQDTLLEHAISGAKLYSWDPTQWPIVGTQPQLTWQHPFGGQPPLGVGRGGVLWKPTFRLLKLHGSTNWYWQQSDTTPSTVHAWFLPGEMPTHEAQPDEETARRRELPGCVPLIVPPVAGKSAYYRSPLLYQLWRDARAALERPEAYVSLLGYSIPQTDLVTSGMLRETLGGKLGTIEIADPNSEPVRDRLGGLGIDIERIDLLPSIESFVGRYLERAANDLVAALRAYVPDPSSDARLLVGASQSDGRKVLKMTRTGTDLELELSTAEGAHGSTNMGPAGEPPPVALSELLRAVRDSAVTRLVARVPGGPSHVLAGAATRVQPTGYGQWQVLIPATVD